MKRALITGASSGIGKATAFKLAAAGVNLILLARREDRLVKISAEIQKHHKVDIVTACVDVSDAKQIDEFVTRYTQQVSETDILVNNAGLAKGSDRLTDGKVADWDVMFDTNVKGLLYMTRAIIPHMVKAQNGHVVNIGSVAGRWVYPGGGVYCATKFAVRALSEGLRMDLLGTPLRVTNIEPGMVETEFSQVRLENSERAKAVYRGMKPLSAEDIADTILWCVQRPKHVNIQELVIFPTDQAALQMVHRRDAEKP